MRKDRRDPRVDRVALNHGFLSHKNTRDVGNGVVRSRRKNSRGDAEGSGTHPRLLSTNGNEGCVAAREKRGRICEAEAKVHDLNFTLP